MSKAETAKKKYKHDLAYRQSSESIRACLESYLDQSVSAFKDALDKLRAAWFDRDLDIIGEFSDFQRESLVNNPKGGLDIVLSQEVRVGYHDTKEPKELRLVFSACSRGIAQPPHVTVQMTDQKETDASYNVTPPSDPDEESKGLSLFVKDLNVLFEAQAPKYPVFPPVRSEEQNVPYVPCTREEYLRATGRL